MARALWSWMAPILPLAGSAGAQQVRHARGGRSHDPGRPILREYLLEVSEALAPIRRDAAHRAAITAGERNALVEYRLATSARERWTPTPFTARFGRGAPCLRPTSTTSTGESSRLPRSEL